MLLGKNVNLFTFTIPTLSISIPETINIPIFGPLGIELAGDVNGTNSIFTAGASISGGYDTNGLAEWANEHTPFDLNKAADDLLDGFFLNTSSNAFLSMGFKIGLGIDVPLVIWANVFGGITGTLTVGLNATGNSDKAYILQELREGDIGSIFNLRGVISANCGIDAQLFAVWSGGGAT